jgi:pimeloyl-ACP methyl ester carboxylesterase
MEDNYDEFSFLKEQALELGLGWKGQPLVSRKFVSISQNRKISALVWGQSPAQIVFLHGGLQNAHSWDGVALALDKPLVALDLPGHGYSSWRSDGDYTPATLREDVAGAVRQLAPQATLVVGMSQGGFISLALAGSYPELVPRLLLVDVLPLAGANPRRDELLQSLLSEANSSFASYDQMLEQTARLAPTRSLASLRRSVLHNARPNSDGSWGWRYDPQMGHYDPARPDYLQLWEELEQHKVPLLVALGSQSAAVGEAELAELARRRPDAQIVVIAGASHSIQSTRPLELASLIEKFMA